MKESAVLKISDCQNALNNCVENLWISQKNIDVHLRTFLRSYKICQFKCWFYLRY